MSEQDQRPLTAIEQSQAGVDIRTGYTRAENESIDAKLTSCSEMRQHRANFLRAWADNTQPVAQRLLDLEYTATQTQLPKELQDELGVARDVLALANAKNQELDHTIADDIEANAQTNPEICGKAATAYDAAAAINSRSRK